MRSFIEEIRTIVGPAGLITSPAEVAPYATDWRKRYLGKPAAVVRPASTAEVAGVVRACAGSRTAIVPQGGNTGLCGAATPDASGTQIILNLSRMNRIREVDARNNTMTAEAGCVLATLHKAAEEGKVAVRHARTHSRDVLKKMSGVSEDDVKHAEKDLQKLHDDYIKKIDDLIKQGLKAGDWIKETAKAAGGGGGGRPQMAQGSGKDASKVGEALDAARKYAQQTVAPSPL